MTDDIDTDPTVTPLQRVEDALHEQIAEQLETPAGDLDLRELAQTAMAAMIPAYRLPERPVEVLVSISDDAGLEVEQNIRLSREQASRPELLGGALGGAAAAALRAFHIGDDGTAADDARAAAELQLGSSS